MPCGLPITTPVAREGELARTLYCQFMRGCRTNIHRRAVHGLKEGRRDTREIFDRAICQPVGCSAIQWYDHFSLAQRLWEPLDRMGKAGIAPANPAHTDKD